MYTTTFTFTSDSDADRFYIYAARMDSVIDVRMDDDYTVTMDCFTYCGPIPADLGITDVT